MTQFTSHHLFSVLFIISGSILIWFATAGVTVVQRPKKANLYRLVKIEQANRAWWIIQRKHWLLGWILISDPIFRRMFTNEDEALSEYKTFLDCKKKPTRTVIRID